jgi:hypothetical protein
MSTLRLMVCTEPSQNAKFSPAVWKLPQDRLH